MPVPVRIRKTSDGYTIPLTRGMRGLVCETGLDMIREISWYVGFNNRGTPYVHSKITPNNLALIRLRLPDKGPTSSFTMHCFLMSPPKGLVVHHINGNTLDNRLSNLTVTSFTLNNAAQPSRGGDSKFKGVSRSGSKWLSRIQIQGKRITLGRFEDEIQAALEYDKAAMEQFGPLATLNFPNHKDLGECSTNLINREKRPY